MSKITRSAKGEDCQVRIIGVCNFDATTTVFAHLGGGGMSAKMPDMLGAYACSDCHDVIDGRVPTKIPKFSIKADFMDGIVRTQIILLEKDLILIK